MTLLEQSASCLQEGSLEQAITSGGLIYKSKRSKAESLPALENQTIQVDKECVDPTIRSQKSNDFIGVQDLDIDPMLVVANKAINEGNTEKYMKIMNANPSERSAVLQQVRDETKFDYFLDDDDSEINVPPDFESDVKVSHDKFDKTIKDLMDPEKSKSPLPGIIT